MQSIHIGADPGRSATGPLNMLANQVISPLTSPSSSASMRVDDAIIRESVAGSQPEVASSATQSGQGTLAGRTQAIQTGLLNLFLRGTRFRQRVGATLMIVFVVFCWGHTSPTALLTWLAAGLSILFVRNRREHAYERSGTTDDAQARDAFIQSMQPLFAVHGGIWGVSLIFCFENIPIQDQLGCWLVLACVASAPLTSVALVPKLLKAYTNPLFAILIAVMLTLTAMKEPSSQSTNYLLLGLPFFYWWLLVRFGKGIHQTQSEQFGLQYDIAQKEQEARAAIETKDRFLAAASHDMRQPVMALSLYAEHLVEFPEMHLELAPKIAVASLAVKHLFESLFDLANLDSGKIALHVERVAVTDALGCLCVQFGPLAAAKNIELRVHGADAFVQTDAVRLQRMIGNVLGNAIKYSPPGRKILLAARVHRDGVRVEVWDQGFGIPAKDIDKVFQEFYRVDRADMPSIDGVGLGLSIVSRLSRVLGARIQISSVVGRGTRFAFHLADVDLADTQRSGALDVG